MKQHFLDEALRIGDELLASAETHEQGISWQTMGLQPGNQKIQWHYSPTIYTGVSGIVLFLLALYQQTKDTKYLKAATAGMQWVMHHCQVNPTNNYALLTGRMGISYSLLKLSKISGDKTFTKQALEIAKPCANFLDQPNPINDFINGTSGTLLGLLHLHQATGEMWLLDKIDIFIRHLLEQVHCTPLGIYWDRSPQNFRGLCGFSHGAAGVGFVFLELGHYFQNEAFYLIAEQAFRYESHFYDQHLQNWLDMRTRLSSSSEYTAYEKAYLAGDKTLFTPHSDTNTWCHGAAGIGLSRLRAYKLLANPLYLNQFHTAVEKTRHEFHTAVEKTRQTSTFAENTQLLSFTLCHGLGGNADIFLEAYRYLGETAYLDLAEAIGTYALDWRQKKLGYTSGYGQLGIAQEDSSLFMGNAGIGYFFLRVMTPRKVPSVLMLATNRTVQRSEISARYSTIHLTPATALQTLVKSNFRRTLMVSKRLIPRQIASHFANHAPDRVSDVNKPFIEFMRSVLANLDNKKRVYL
ncbi:MAG TPA: hypothetical protein EYH05_15600, partial [Anaerolineae bacterium]|nr:hypothetical protein [Anaerolineae bacterium]